MTCKDCIHSGICAIQLEPHYVLDRTQKLMRESNNVEHECLSFKDGSRFVELPCKLGDEIFCTIIGKIHQAVVDRIELYDEGVAIITADGYCVDSTICYHTQEEAEQALKERETE